MPRGLEFSQVVSSRTWNYPGLSRISVFDSKTVPLYGDKKNKIEILPQGLDVLPKLGMSCKDIANKIESDLKYPGEIRVTIIREKRITEYAR